MSIEMKDNDDGIPAFVGIVPYSMLASSGTNLNHPNTCDNYKTTTLDCYKEPQKKANSYALLSQRLARIFHEQQHGRRNACFYYCAKHVFVVICIQLLTFFWVFLNMDHCLAASRLLTLSPHWFHQVYCIYTSCWEQNFCEHILVSMFGLCVAIHSIAEQIKLMLQQKVLWLRAMDFACFVGEDIFWWKIGKTITGCFAKISVNFIKLNSVHNHRFEIVLSR